MSATNTNTSTTSTNIVKDPAGQAATKTGAVVKRVIIDARAEAEQLLAQARTEAANVRNSAESFARQAREDAYNEGREAALVELNEHLVAARERREAALIELELDVLRLSVKIAEKIIGHEIDHDDSSIADIVATALRQAKHSEMVTVRVNPSDMVTIEKFRARLEPGGRMRFIDFTPDPRVKSGGCVIVTDTGTIDAQLHTQLGVLERALLARATKQNP